MIDQTVEDERAPEIEEKFADGNKVSDYGQLGLKKKRRKFFSRFIPRIARRGDSKNTDIKVINYLDHNQELLKDYVMKSVTANQLQSWLDQKMSLEPEKTDPTNSQSLIRKRDTPKDFFMNCETKLKQNWNELSSILELLHYITSAVTIDAYRIYKIDPNDSNSIKYLILDSPNSVTLETEFSSADGNIVKLVLEAASKQKSLRLSRENFSGFPKTPSTLLHTFGFKNEKEANHLFYQPITTIGKTIYVVEMWRIKDKFDDKDEEICANIVVAFHYCNLYMVKQRESNMSDILLDVVKTIFKEMISLDQLIKSILKSAQRLVNADRASLFLVDNDNSELVSTVFDLKLDHEQDKNGIQPVRMSIKQGIAGCVASSGEVLNIPNAYSDDRFNSKVDMATGYKTKSILCMPIKVRGKVIGVVEMINKINNLNFDHEDEIAFQKFSIFFGLALHNAKLYAKVKRNEERFQVAMEVLSYHNTCKDNEVQEVQNENWALPTNFNDFYLDPYELDHLQKCKAALKMFDILFDISKFDSTAVTKFILTVKKNYRMVPYHNFDHGWSVAHTMYVILKNDYEHRFDYKMKLALFVACLCHDLDHRGYNNDYLKETEAPLAAMYSSSPLEHHHFSITVTILQQDGHNIFSQLSREDYKEVLEHIKQNILATDLAVFSTNLAQFKHIFAENSDQQTFNWEILRNRKLAMALSMTASDLSASAKPWTIQMKTVEVIFEEFYLQGDKEREANKTPIPMMDRTKPDDKPTSQVAFLNHICIPCYSMLYKIFPRTKPLYEMVLQNRDNWLSRCVNDDSEHFEKDNTLSLGSE
ncbi:probable 3',5'-cyclic phosphodiesterase pde-5 [Maniola jurtina]|uniref:probable 3',5'-cyclic phosphodiesterase pde-5 n=1 Tax=Maniola jurtina TaxID=191418 RepID=UPI001E68CE33|nr:probable 3',5'-cyclic phosphodiesterase pde-5 [Maniola jurtina]